MNLLEQLYGSFQMWLNTQSEMEILIFALVVIMITGTFGGLLAKRLKQPLLLGYILAGVFVGIAFKAGFGAAATVALDSLANIGVALLLFSMGLEFEKKILFPSGMWQCGGHFPRWRLRLWQARGSHGV